ncbi:MAG: carbohydrate kinase [Eudoraea sp.]|nr:carbohydrate kinase [Eudoraea sp.]
MKKVFCVGELLIDFVAEKQGSDLSKAMEFTKKAGGAPANVACAISKLGGQGAFVGCAGIDPFGRFLIDVLMDKGVDCSLVQRSDTFTTLAFVSLAEDGERDFVFSRGADRELQYDPEVKKEFKGNMIHFGAATALLGGPLEKAYGHYYFDALTQDIFISFDPNYRGDLWKNKADKFVTKCLPYIEKAHLCKFSLEEAQLISGKEGLEEACAAIHEMGAQTIVITLGKEGTFISTSDQQSTIPSIPVTPVDTTGAGDAFIGCLLYQISQLENPNALSQDFALLEKMVAMANKAGAITTTNYGAIESLPDLNALNP